MFRGTLWQLLDYTPQERAVFVSLRLAGQTQPGAATVSQHEGFKGLGRRRDTCQEADIDTRGYRVVPELCGLLILFLGEVSTCEDLLLFFAPFILNWKSLGRWSDTNKAVRKKCLHSVVCWYLISTLSLEMHRQCSLSSVIYKQTVPEEFGVLILEETIFQVMFVGIISAVCFKLILILSWRCIICNLLKCNETNPTDRRCLQAGVTFTSIWRTFLFKSLNQTTLCCHSKV